MLGFDTSRPYHLEEDNMQHGRTREDMEYHDQNQQSWMEEVGTKRHGRYFWDSAMSDTEYIQNWYKATKGRASKVFRPSKSRDKK